MNAINPMKTKKVAWERLGNLDRKCLLIPVAWLDSVKENLPGIAGSKSKSNLEY